jgi:hypothetical protein
MADKDDYRVQRRRIERLVAESEPAGMVHWDESRVPTFINLRVDHPLTGAILIVSAGDWHVSEIADKTDDELRQLLRAWSGGRL